MASNRIFRPLLWLLILTCGFLGLAWTIAPATFASLAGFAGTGPVHVPARRRRPEVTDQSLTEGAAKGLC